MAISVRNLASDTWDTYQRTFTVVASNPLMAIDAPTANQAVSQPFAIAGWAVDTGATSGTGVDAVSILAYLNPGSGAAPITLGTVTYGGARSDVAATLGSQFLNSGYTRTESSLAAGLYRFHVFAHSTQTDAWDLRTVDASVDVSAVSLTIDRSGTGTGGVTASGLTCTGGAGTQAVPCSASYAPGASVTLTAAADSGSTFSGWAGPCTGTSPCSVTLTTARYVSATFTKTPTAAVLTYYHTDMIGSVRAITDEAGATVIRHDYGPFGEDTQPMTGDPIRFGGKELDPETGLANFEARYFRQTWGRFSAVDPVGGSLGDTQSWNRYAYARNNPLRFVDPTGTNYRVDYDHGPFAAESSDYTDGQFLELVTYYLYPATMRGTDFEGTFEYSGGEVIAWYHYYDDGGSDSYERGRAASAEQGDSGGGSAPSGVCSEAVQDMFNAAGLAADATVVGTVVGSGIDVVSGLVALGCGDRIGAGLSFLSVFGVAGNIAREGRSIAKAATEGLSSLGRRGTNSAIRVVEKGGATAAEELFAKLSRGGTNVTPRGYNGTLMRLPDGGVVGYRPVSKSGPATIDVNIPGVPIEKIKFP